MNKLDINYNKNITYIKEIVPELSLDTIEQIFHKSNNDLQRAVNFALSMNEKLKSKQLTSNGHDHIKQNKKQIKESKESENSSTPPLPQRTARALSMKRQTVNEHPLNATSPESSPEISTKTQDSKLSEKLEQNTAESTSSSIKQENSSGKYNKRGSNMYLPASFMVAPLFRRAITCKTPTSIEFSVHFRRSKRSIGISIREINDEIIVVSMNLDDHSNNINSSNSSSNSNHSQRGSLAWEAGVRVGDILVAVNEQRLGPHAEVADVLDLLAFSGAAVQLTFLRRFVIPGLEMHRHVAVDHFLQQNLLTTNSSVNSSGSSSSGSISGSSSELAAIDRVIRHLKEQLLAFDDRKVRQRILDWKLDQTLRASNSNYASTTEGVEETSRLSVEKRLSLRAYSNNPHSSSFTRSNGSSPMNSSNNISALSDNNYNNNYNSNNSNSNNSSSNNSKLMKRRSSRRYSIENLPSLDHLEQMSNHAYIHTNNTALSVNSPLTSPTNLNGNDLNGNNPSSSSGARNLDIWAQRSADSAGMKYIRPALLATILQVDNLTIETAKHYEEVLFKIYVLDVRSGYEYIIKKSMREFVLFRERLMRLRPELKQVRFPQVRSTKISMTLLEGEYLSALQAFLSELNYRTYVNMLLPSVARCRLHLQQFLQVDEHIDFISLQETLCEQPDGSVRGGGGEVNCSLRELAQRSAEVLLHQMLQLPPVKRVIGGFVEEFTNFENLQRDEQLLNFNFQLSGYERQRQVGRAHCDALVAQLKDFLENMQHFLEQCFHADALEILAEKAARGNKTRTKHSALVEKICALVFKENEEVQVQAQDVEVEVGQSVDGTVNTSDSNDIQPDIQLHPAMMSHESSPRRAAGRLFPIETPDLKHTSRKSSLWSSMESPQSDRRTSDASAGRSTEMLVAQMTANDAAQIYDAMLQQNEDDMNNLVRAAIRRQLETEVYLPCAARVHSVVARALQRETELVRKKMLQLSQQPQLFFGISLEQLSPSSWSSVILALKELPRATLPCEKIRHLLTVAKSIPVLYRAEHPESKQTLGADDMLPIFIYVLIQSHCSEIVQANYELQALSDPATLLGEAGYFLATLEAALTHILETNVFFDKPFFTPHK